ncbi:hypothetical protein K2173_004792 [Erythroxylum novogranatense]|uniref:Reverse transcriptase/retrotransposon-derived protein RNase H-like domain-containing protein n=1 Tax=Erythroxylum novogranatense TaxID=1862640 RepID=A0AAV8SKI6_9ROSI|nr:hypothetical protein K2173_004792 [Erythroxylum novogranatense]
MEREDGTSGRSNSSFIESQQVLMKRMTELASNINSRFEQLSIAGKSEGESSAARPAGNHRYTNHTTFAPKFKLEFPRFNGQEDPTKCNKKRKLDLAELKEELYARYGPTEFFDPFGALTKLRKKIQAKAGRLSPEKQVSCFVSGLKDTIRTEVQANRPATLSTAISLARLFEAKIISQKRLPSTVPKSNSLLTRSTTVAATASSVKKLSVDELNERRKLGLCFRCNEKYEVGHRCKKLFSIQVVQGDSEDDVDMEIEDPEEEKSSISIHALTGSPNPRTMRLKGQLKRSIATILVDTGSTHNFINADFAEKAHIPISSSGRFEVLVASGDRLFSKGKSKQVPITIQGFTTWVDLYLLPLEGCDIVLGTCWLETMGPIIWDFSHLTMKFNFQGKDVVSDAQVVELTKNIRYGIYLHIIAASSPQAIILPEVRDILKRFCTVLQEPTTLPPIRSQDHRIPLVSGHGPISVRPYRYPQFQKTEIEKLVSDMLRAGIIRHSHSPYSSPVLLTVFSLLQSHQLFVKLEKCQFGQQNVKYLGHIISNHGVAVDPEKIEAISAWPKPITQKAMRGFLGLCGYYRKFIQSFGKIAAPLTDMLKKNHFAWSKEAEEAFSKLKQAMTQAPVLALPDFSNKFIVECDASGSGIGAVLRQERPIAFFSQALHGKNRFLSTYEKEILALVLAVEKWRPYLLGRQFIVQTDHQSLRHLWTQKIATTAQQRWLLKLMGFDFIIEYKAGKENIVADALSRKYEEDGVGHLQAISKLVPNWVDTIKEEHANSPFIQHMFQLLQKDDVVGPWENKDGIIFFKQRIYLEKDSPLLLHY